MSVINLESSTSATQRCSLTQVMAFFQLVKFLITKSKHVAAEFVNVFQVKVQFGQNECSVHQSRKASGGFKEGIYRNHIIILDDSQ